MILKRSYNLAVLLLFLTITMSYSQAVIRPNFKLKAVGLSDASPRSSFINYPDLTKKDTVSLFSKREQELLNKLMEQNKIMEDFILKEKTEEITRVEKEAKLMFSLPLDKIKITSEFGHRIHPINNVPQFHNGIDIRAKYEPINSVLNGVVIEADYNDKNGNYVFILSNKIETRFLHLSEVHVSKGDKVKAGQIIAISGNTGLSKHPHLHFETLINNKIVDPGKLLLKLNNLN